MKKIVSLVIALMVVGLTVVAQQNVNRNHYPVTVDVTEINNTNSDGVTRISVRLTSMPNTSSRVDSVTLVVPCGKKLKATDIDGVDFKRYFQWEENGIVNVDVDFPLCKKPAGSKIIFHTVYGDFSGKVNSRFPNIR